MKTRELKTVLLLLLCAVWLSSCSEFKHANPVFKGLIDAAKDGDATAQYEMAVLVRSDWLGQSDTAYREAIKWCKKAAKQGHADAQYWLGLHYNCIGSPKWYNVKEYLSEKKSAYWYKKAAEQGHAEAQYHLGAWSFPPDEDAKMWVRRAAAQGYRDAYSTMAGWVCSEIFRANPEANPENPVYQAEHEEECREYMEWMRKYDLARRKRPYSAPDKVLIKWLKKLSVQGQENAQTSLGDIYYEHENFDEAEKWYRQSAELGSVRGQYGLGRVSKDKVEAIQWLTKAAEKGYLEAQLALAFLYDKGSVHYEKNSSPNDSLSFKWYLAAAEQGSWRAQGKLAKMYVDGTGTEPDEREALKWFLAKNDQGSGVKEVRSIIYMYINEKGVLEDPIEACAWYIFMTTYSREIPQKISKYNFTRSGSGSYMNELISAHAKKLTDDQLKIVRARAVQICLENAQRNNHKKYIKLYKND